jgi:hypothetical protein
MSSKTALYGIELVDCANANSQENIAVVAALCGFDNDIEAFERELKKAGEEIGIKIPNFSFLTEISNTAQNLGTEIAPDSESVL